MKLVFLYMSILLLSCMSLNAQIVVLPAYQAMQYQHSTVKVATTAITNNTNGATATSGGTITGFGTVTDRGICWSTSTAPTTASSTIANGSGLGTYTSGLTGLMLSTTYYVRAYAIVAGTTVYGNEITFTTPQFPTFYTTGTLQYFTVPAGVTSIIVEAAGGNGASSTAAGGTLAAGGIGAITKGTFTLTAGTELELLVGANGIASVYGNILGGGGGGGGSWVVKSGVLLMVAGGGGGGSSSIQHGNAGGRNALTTNAGGSAIKGTGGSLANPATIYTGGTGGNGGNGLNNSIGSTGGGGWLTDGVGYATSVGKKYPGAAPPIVGFGGGGGISGGGYGGGGSGWASAYQTSAAGGGGGGGGYSGGGGVSLMRSVAVPTNFEGSGAGGGGGSYNIGTNPVNFAGSSHAQPYIKIVW